MPHPTVAITNLSIYGIYLCVCVPHDSSNFLLYKKVILTSDKLPQYTIYHESLEAWALYYTEI